MIKTKTNTSNLILIPLLLVYILTAQSCSKDIEDYKMFEQVFYDDTDEKLWRHRVNTSSEATEYLQYFRGIELDVQYNGYQDKFYIAHDDDYDKDNTETLKGYFSKISSPKNYYYWIDFKNINIINDGLSLKRLEEVVGEFDIKSNLIIESKHPERLKKYNEEGYFTSYWIPYTDYYGELTEDHEKDLDEIKKNMEECRHNAISAHANSALFLSEFLPEYNVHIWTNGWDTEDDKERINSLKLLPNIKIILIDFERPF